MKLSRAIEILAGTSLSNSLALLETQRVPPSPPAPSLATASSALGLAYPTPHVPIACWVGRLAVTWPGEKEKGRASRAPLYLDHSFPPRHT